MKEPR